MTMRRVIPILLSILLMMASGCSFLSRSKSQFYSLERIPPAGPVANVGGLPIGIDTVELPPGFDRREIVVRQTGNRLDVRGTQQWSASLELMVLHTLAFDLAGRLPDGMVILPGQAKPVGPARSINVVVEEIGAGPERVVLLDARWILRQPGLADVSRHERISIAIESLDSAQIATGLSRALADFVDRIVAQLSTSGP